MDVSMQLEVIPKVFIHVKTDVGYSFAIAERAQPTILLEEVVRKLRRVEYRCRRIVIEIEVE